MIRRSHKKSRQGCTHCKRSHKKCDETKPSCVNCTIANKKCSYIQAASKPSSNSQSPNNNGPGISFVAEDLAGSSDQRVYSHATDRNQSGTPVPAPPRPEPYVNILHLELYQNLISENVPTFGDETSKAEWVATTKRYTFEYPYIMYESLAMSAFQLSIKHPSKSAIYFAESTALQAKALSLFNESCTTLTQDNTVPAFLFAAILGLHCFCDTFSMPSPDLNTFLDCLVQSIRLLRGIQATTGTSWDYIRNSDIKVLLADEGQALEHDDKITCAFDNLKMIFSQSHTLSAFEAKVYGEAIDGLIKVYNTQLPNGESHILPDARIVMSWPINVSAEYTELLH
ncbi:hypothetical protein ONS95_000330 [Cadophora gregata]|uniref:uncharacterized protein n=1 Tax=Cadophora gregata TaxID=51156 RepID=UPI0026DDC727|nr:uncharacterized protein ONS95_000330 [Cadophora gregata]KAK0125667.1 hypothetical protein ONS96_009500 [Cadophora gregata f. sp. sojae]KAK0128358.1 hypothetical protein ONS95_000330 [Cadophora gregata]